ncbi:MAG: hypothetical protein ACP5KN_18725 [Armatimonadota bacterium]
MVGVLGLLGYAVPTWGQQGVGLRAAPPGDDTPEAIVDIDFNDEVINRPEPMTEEEVVGLVDDLHSHGCETIIVRMGFLGLLPYRTELSYPLEFDEEDFRERYWGSEEDADRLAERNTDWLRRYRAALEAYNPPEVFIRAGHERGMKVIMWIDIYDDYYPGFHSKFLDENPQCQWTAKDGTRFEGLTQYAWPEARQFRVQQATELLDLGADGIHLSTSAHCRHMPNVHQDDFYGYGRPIVEEYRRRHGVDILDATEFDTEAWHRIKGEAVNELYRQVAAVCHERERELWIGLQLGDYVHMAANPYFGDNVVARYRNLWQELVTDGIADAIIVADYEVPGQSGGPYWVAKEGVPAGEDLYAFGARQYGPLCREHGVQMYLFGEWLVGEHDRLDALLAEKARHVLENGYDGIDLHEAANFERGRMVFLQRFVQRLAGVDPGPFPFE